MMRRTPDGGTAGVCLSASFKPVPRWDVLPPQYQVVVVLIPASTLTA